MDSLVAANVRQRPLRTALSIIGVALGVVLVSMTVGLAHGMMRNTAERQANIFAEIILYPQGNFSPSTGSPLDLDQRYGDVILRGNERGITPVTGVVAVSPVANYLQTSTSGIGFELLEGVDFETYTKVTSLHLVEGRIPSGNEVVVDSWYAKHKTGADGAPVRIGSEILVFGTKMPVVGVFDPEVGARIKMPLDTMQRKVVGGAAKVSMLLIKCDRPADQEIVAGELKAKFPDKRVVLTRDLPALFSGSIGSLEVFLKVVIWLAAIVSTLVILLAMYTTITERTREIGILRSLGASKRFVVATIEQEALLISALGVLLGIAAAVVGKAGIERFTSLHIDLEAKWIFYSTLLGLVCGALGALYPALRAAQKDPVEALSYE
jgi:putative ABC transport system permease protein